MCIDIGNSSRAGVQGATPREPIRVPVTGVESDIDRFMSLVASEPGRIGTVGEAPPDVLARARKPGGMKLTDFLAASRGRMRQRSVRFLHILGPPAASETIAAWEAGTSHRLPVDLRDLVSRINGIHLWANEETGRSNQGLAPIEDWALARSAFHHPEDEGRLGDRYVAISYHADGACLVTLDTASGGYFLMDACGVDATCPIGDNVGDLLDWLWRKRIPPA
jgi:hypothetical protein